MNKVDKIYYFNEDTVKLIEVTQGMTKFKLEQLVAFQGWNWTPEEAIDEAIDRLDEASDRLHAAFRAVKEAAARLAAN